MRIAPAGKITRAMMRGYHSYRALLCAATLALPLTAPAALAQQLGAADYAANCAGCHGVDGKGNVAAMRGVPGYRSIDLTLLSKKHGGVFPRQEVTAAIDGRHRMAAHFSGDMPRWGSQFQAGSGDDAAAKHRIAALVDYIESLQETSEPAANR